MTPDTAQLIPLLTTAALVAATIEYVQVVRRRVKRRAAADDRSAPQHPGRVRRGRRRGHQPTSKSDLLERASAAWWAASEELDLASKVRGPSSPVGSSGVLPIGDVRVERSALNVATSKLRALLGELQAATTTARAWGAEIGLDGLNLPGQIEGVEAQTGRVRTLRERYEAQLRGGR